MNPQLSSLSQASALVIYVLSFSQETQTADCSLPLCSTQPCIWILLCYFPNIFLDQATRFFFCFLGGLGSTALGTTPTIFLAIITYLASTHGLQTRETQEEEEEVIKTETSLFYPHLATWEGNLIATFTHAVQKNPMCYGSSTAGDRTAQP